MQGPAQCGSTITHAGAMPATPPGEPNKHACWRGPCFMSCCTSGLRQVSKPPPMAWSWYVIQVLSLSCAGCSNSCAASDLVTPSADYGFLQCPTNIEPRMRLMTAPVVWLLQGFEAPSAALLCTGCCSRKTTEFVLVDKKDTTTCSSSVPFIVKSASKNCVAGCNLSVLLQQRFRPPSDVRRQMWTRGTATYNLGPFTCLITQLTDDGSQAQMTASSLNA